MKGERKFELADRVLIKSKGKQGDIKQYRIEGAIDKNGNVEETIKYYIKYGQYLTEWFPEDDLQLPDSFDVDFENGLLDLLINVNLKANNLDNVKQLHNQKQQYKKG